MIINKKTIRMTLIIGLLLSSSSLADQIDLSGIDSIDNTGITAADDESIGITIINRADHNSQMNSNESNTITMDLTDVDIESSLTMTDSLSGNTGTNFDTVGVVEVRVSPVQVISNTVSNTTILQANGNLITNGGE